MDYALLVGFSPQIGTSFWILSVLFVAVQHGNLTACCRIVIIVLICCHVSHCGLFLRIGIYALMQLLKGQGYAHQHRVAQQQAAEAIFRKRCVKPEKPNLNDV